MKVNLQLLPFSDLDVFKRIISKDVKTGQVVYVCCEVLHTYLYICKVRECAHIMVRGSPRARVRVRGCAHVVVRVREEAHTVCQVSQS